MGRLEWRIQENLIRNGDRSQVKMPHKNAELWKKRSKPFKLDELSDLENYTVSLFPMKSMNFVWILGVSWNTCKTFHNDGCRGELSEYRNVGIIRVGPGDRIDEIRLCQHRHLRQSECCLGSVQWKYHLWETQADYSILEPGLATLTDLISLDWWE